MAKEYAETRRRAIELDEVDLVMAAQKGDLEAFNQLILRYQERVFNLCVRILGDDDSAENVTQDTFLIAYRSLGRFRNGSFRSWILRIATNACYDVLRYRKRHPVRSLEYEDDAEERYFPLYDLPERDTHP